jgi:hypothetical protein
MAIPAPQRGAFARGIVAEPPKRAKPAKVMERIARRERAKPAKRLALFKLKIKNEKLRIIARNRAKHLKS